MIRELSGNVTPKSVYCDVPGAAAFVSEVLDAKLYDGVMFTIQAEGAAEAVTAKVTECDTSGGTYADITGATFSLVHTATGSVLYTCYAKRAKRYMKVSVTSTPTAAVAYSICAIGHGLKEVPAS